MLPDIQQLPYIQRISIRRVFVSPFIHKSEQVSLDIHLTQLAL